MMCFNPKFSWGHNLSFFALGPSMVLMIEWLVLLLDGIKCMYIAVDQLSTIWVIIRYSKVVNSRHCFVSIQPQCLVTEETYLPSSAHSHKDNLCIQPVSYVVYNYWYNIWWYICRGGCPCNYSKCCFIPLKRCILIPWHIYCCCLSHWSICSLGDAILWSQSEQGRTDPYQGRIWTNTHLARGSSYTCTCVPGYMHNYMQYFTCLVLLCIVVL